jgi:amino acid transporter
MDAATVIVTLLLAALFMFSASIKLLGVSRSLAIRDHLGVKRMAPPVIGIALAAATAVLHPL